MQNPCRTLLTAYLKKHPGWTWGDFYASPEFRDLACQPVGEIGETFLLAKSSGLIILYHHPALEGKTLEQAIARQGRGTGSLTIQYGGTEGIKEFKWHTGDQDRSPCHGFLVPLGVEIAGGPELMVGTWVDPEEVRLVVGQPRAILRTAMNLSQALLGIRLGQFQFHQFLLLAGLGLLGFGCSLVLGYRLSSRVEALREAAEAFDRGELRHRVRNPGKDELGELARTLNRMAASLEENTVSRGEWENTFNVLPDPVILVDREGRITRLNRAAVMALEILPQDALHHQVADLRQSPGAALPVGVLLNALACDHHTHLEFCAENGKSFLVTVDPCWDRQQEVSGRVFVARDISSLKQMQKDLAQTSHFLEQLIEAVPLALVFINRQGIITRVNPQVGPEFGYRPEDLLNRHYAHCYADEEERRQVLAELREKGEVIGRQVKLKNHRGETVPARLAIRKLYNEKGEVVGSVSLACNISEEISLQRQLEQAQRQEVVATLAGGLAHNFNNLLTVIMGLTSLMMTKIPPDHPAVADLRDIERQVQSGREIVRKLLSFRRDTDVDTQPVDLNHLVETTADMFARTRSELVVRKNLAPHLPAVEINPGQLQQVLMNLLINAWQAMPQGGEITLETRLVQVTDWQDLTWDLKPGHYVCLSVSDTGVGMSEEVMAHLFEPFFTTKEAGVGSGLGLASAYRIMKNHRGAIQVASKEGEGTTFTLFLAASQARPPLAWPEDRCLVSGEGTILVVDDDVVLGRVAAKLLQKLGYQVVLAANGEEALAIYRERGKDIDLVLLDMVMPGLNGWQTLDRLRELNPQVRVLLCSGLEENCPVDIPPGIDFIPKPYPLEILSQKVAQTLNN